MYRPSSRLLLILWALVCCQSLLILPVMAQEVSKQWIEKATAPSPVSGQPRLALILGNTNYGKENELKNPENDAKAIARALGKLGFNSTVLLDSSLDQMSDAIHAFADKIRISGTSSVALLYYSGHGMQVNGENYLIPIGFKMPRNERDMNRHALSAQSAIDEMQQANAQINIAILDACRNNPFDKDRGIGGKGLAKLETQGMLIAYATAAGTTASDNTDGQNGLYTASLLKYLQKPGLKLYEIFKSTAKSVYIASNHKQFPYVYDGLIDDDDFYLLPSGTGTAPIKGNGDGNQLKAKINQKDGAEMILIPAGDFLMGDDDILDNPRRTVNLSAYYIYKNLVTVEMYENFCAATNREMPSAPNFDPNWSKKDHPIVNVRWSDAKAYCDWAGVELPTEAQWEKAARGTDGRKYPWGEEFDRSKLWMSKVRQADAGGTEKVGSFPSGASPYGVLDMAGNAWQWCADSSNSATRELRGGSWDATDPYICRTAYRNRNNANIKYFAYGFRCASSETP